MKQFNFTVTERNGVQVFTSKRTGRTLTGGAKKACEEALRRQQAEQARNIAEEEKYVKHLEEIADIITGKEMTFTPKTHTQPRIQTQTQPRNIAEEEEYVKHLEAQADLITGKEIIPSFTHTDIINLQINDKHQEGIAITGWAFNQPMLQRIARALWDEELMRELCTNHKEIHIITGFISQGLRAMGWKYNRDRKEGFTRAAERFLWRRLYDFDARKSVEEGKKILPGQFDPQSVREAMKAVIRCAKWAMERSESEVITNNKTRPILAMICARLLKAITTRKYR